MLFQHYGEALQGERQSLSSFTLKKDQQSQLLMINSVNNGFADVFVSKSEVAFILVKPFAGMVFDHHLIVSVTDRV